MAQGRRAKPRRASLQENQAVSLCHTQACGRLTGVDEGPQQEAEKVKVFPAERTLLRVQPYKRPLGEDDLIRLEALESPLGVRFEPFGRVDELVREEAGDKLQLVEAVGLLQSLRGRRAASFDSRVEDSAKHRFFDEEVNDLCAVTRC